MGLTFLPFGATMYVAKCYMVLRFLRGFDMLATLIGIKPVDFTGDSGDTVKGTRVGYYYPHPDWFGNKVENRFVRSGTAIYKTLANLVDSMDDSELDCMAVPVSIEFDGDGKLIGLAVVKNQ